MDLALLYYDVISKYQTLSTDHGQAYKAYFDIWLGDRSATMFL